MMDALEAIRGLDGYTETLGSLGALLGAKLFEEKSPEHDSLLDQLKQQQIDAKSIALMIMKDIHTVGTRSNRSGELAGVNAAILRYLEADKKAGEALGKINAVPVRSPLSEAIDRFRKNAGLADPDS